MKNALSSLFLWFYCRDLFDAALIILTVTVLFLLLHHRLAGKCWWTGTVGLGLGCWLFVICCSTILERSSGGVFQHSFVPFHSYRQVWNGGNVEIYRSNFMNAVLFYPAGLLATSLLPRKWARWSRCLMVVLVLAVMSAGIEFLQFRHALGCCEIDDVIHNTAGALLGSLGAVLLPLFLSFLKAKADPK